MALTDTDAIALGAIVEGILYGAYIVLFILYLILLFGLCTLSICLDISKDYFLEQDVENVDTALKIEEGSMVIFTIIDYLAQMILLYRCWIIWDQRWVVVAVPGFLALVTLGGGFTLFGLIASPLPRADPEKFNRLYTSIGTMAYSISLAVNALTTSLLVTKILLTSRHIYPGSGSNLHRPLRIITAMLVESGVLMLAFQLVFVVLFSTQLPAFEIISAPITQIYGITPTILSIRVVMGSAYDKTTEKTRSLRFAHSRAAATHTSGAGVSITGAQSRVIDIDLGEDAI